MFYDKVLLYSPIPILSDSIIKQYLRPFFFIRITFTYYQFKQLSGWLLKAVKLYCKFIVTNLTITKYVLAGQDSNKVLKVLEKSRKVSWKCLTSLWKSILKGILKVFWKKSRNLVWLSGWLLKVVNLYCNVA